MLGSTNAAWERDREGIWQKYCSFLNISLDTFMGMQERLLLEQIQIVRSSVLGQRFFSGQLPRTRDEFRQAVPLTVYDNYSDILDKKWDDGLPIKPFAWVHTSGGGGTFRWVPYTPLAYERLVDASIACLVLATARAKGEASLEKGMRVLCNIPPMPYLSGLLARGLVDRLGLCLIPPLDDISDLDFDEKTERAFKMALRSGVDVIASLSSVLAKVGEHMAERSDSIHLSRSTLHPTVLYRLARAYLRSRLARRRILPKDIWPVRAILGWGMDTDLFREDIRRYWGQAPYEAYATTEVGIIGIQSWARRGLTPLPFVAHYEFISEEERLKGMMDRTYQPRTILLPEVTPGRRYELVVTSYYGMPFLRYRIGHFVRVLSLADKDAGIALPQIAFDGRADDLIDIGNFTRLDERTVFRALRLTDTPFKDWTLRKEVVSGKPVLHLYIELKGTTARNGLEHRLHDKLKECDSFYLDLDRMLQIRPLRVTNLAPGTFARYYEEKARDGADLASRRPPRMNPLESQVRELLEASDL